MGEGLQTADGTALDVPPADDQVNRDFAAAMNAPEPGEPQVAAPPKRDPAADPEAPHGRTKDGKPKKGPGGRPPKPTRAEAPRVQPAAAAAAAPTGDYTEGLAELGEGLWFLMAAGPPPMRAQAALFKVHRPNLVRGFNMAAQHQPMIRAGVEFLTAQSWITILGAALVPFIMGSIGLWSGKIPPELVEQLAAATARDLEEIEAKQAAEFFAAAGIAADPQAA